MSYFPSRNELFGDFTCSGNSENWEEGMGSEGRSGTLLGRFRRRIASDQYSYGLRRDLTLLILRPAAEIPITVRPMRLNDIPALLSGYRRSVPAMNERMDPRKLIEAGISHAYVAVTRSDSPCYMQWLIVPSDNEKIQKLSEGLLPWLGSDEILLDQAFTLESFRGLGIMPCALAQIAEIGREYGARWALTFVDVGDIAALKGCQLAGFRPYLVRRESRRLLHRRISFHLLPRGTPFPFEDSKGDPATEGFSLAG
jgi:hypothetical protein